MLAILILIIFGIIIIWELKRSLYNKFSSSVKITGLFLFTLVGLFFVDGIFQNYPKPFKPQQPFGNTGNIVAALFMMFFFLWLG
ncbi:MAG: hypothetical protein CM1200mP1_08070 [Candidatus Neomarinimicrobiota bacterium]|nr:MAG: hypothetical protein CM1200mP1_08070 [Candidatus Neomarinimicrobiota bacterium]